MDEKHRNIITTNIRQSINQKLDFHLNSLEFALVKVYINYQNSKVWENTNLEGYLVLVNDCYHNSLKLQIFDFINFNKEFEIELYPNIEDGYEVLKDTFHSLEFPTFFVGLNFSEKSHAEKIRNKIILFSKIKNLDKYFSSFIYDQDKENSILDNQLNYSPTIKNNGNNNKILTTIVSNNKNTNQTFSNYNNLKNNSEEFNLKYAKTLREINSSDIKFKKVERILELEIENNSMNNCKNPIISPDLKTGESKFLYEKYIKSKNLYFENIQSFFKDLKKKYESISLQNESGDFGSMMQIDENQFDEISGAEHNNENEEFIAYNLEKRNTIKIRSFSYLQRVEEQKANNNKNSIENTLNDNSQNNEKNVTTNFKINNENLANNNNDSDNISTLNKANNNSKINFSKENKKSSLLNNNLGIKSSQIDDDIINRYSNNKNLNHAIGLKRAMAYQDIEEETSESKISDFE